MHLVGNSIRTRLLAGILALLVIISLALAIAMYRAVAHETEELFDANLAQSARFVLGFAVEEAHEQHGLVFHFDNFVPGFHRYEHKLAYIVVDGSGREIARSPLAPPAIALSPHNGFHNQKIGEQHWRAFQVQDPATGFRVWMADDLSAREELASHAAWGALWPFVLIMPLAGGLIWLVVGEGLRPLRRLANKVAGRGPHDMSLLDTETNAIETRPLIDAINLLLKRLERALESERQFTSDAAHELRTPLAALRVQAQVLDRTDDGEDRTRALSGIIEGVDRSTHLVNQLLVLARLDPEHSSVDKELIDLHLLAQEVVVAESDAIGKRVNLSVQSPGSLKCWCYPAALEVILVNLVSNAVRYSHEGADVLVTLKADEHSVYIVVDDSGPGIPPAEREKVLKRCYRIPGTSVPGSGLGLAIAQRAAALHQGTLILNESHLGGLQVSVSLSIAERTSSDERRIVALH